MQQIAPDDPVTAVAGIYAARGLLHVGNAPDDGEFLESVTVSMSEALRWIEDGTITDVKTIIGLMWANKSRES